MTPDLAAFLNTLGAELIFGQVLISRVERGFELRHVEDRMRVGESLETKAMEQLRELAQFTAKGVFRPLRSAPDLRRGWRVKAPDGEALGLALGALYPGAVPDWYAARRQSPPVTSYREFTARQTGMYRVTTHLDGAMAEAAIRACCAPDFCLKRRLWTAGRSAPDSAREKSLIPCLEPCALMLELARQIARWEQHGEHSGINPSNNPRLARFLQDKQKLANRPDLK